MREPEVHANPAVEVSDLTLGYPAHGGARAHHAVEGVTFSVPRGGVLGLLGESGSGKSTLATFLAGRGGDAADRTARVRVWSGDARVLGVPMRRLSRRATARLIERVGYLGQTTGATFAPDITISDLLLQAVQERRKPVDHESLGLRIAEMLDLVGLPLRALGAYPFELSKGQRQRIAVVRALMREPTLVVADEPTLGVDATGRPRIVELLRWYRERTAATMLLVTHDIGVLEALVEDVIVLQQGALVGAGTINEIFRRADHPYVQQLARALRSTAYDEVSEE